MQRIIVGLAVAALFGLPSAAAAQSTAWGNSGYVSFNGLYEASSESYDVTTLQEINLETASIVATQETGERFVGDIMAGGRISGNLGVGFGLTYGRNTNDATVTASIPHPFYFDEPRTLTGTTPLRRDDIAIHLDGMLLLPISEPFQVSVFGGATWFQVKQDVIQEITLEENFPFDEVSLGEVTLEEQKGSGWGYNVGVDASYFFTQYVGVQGMARFSKGTVTLGPEDNESSVKAGGLQVGAGLRVRF